MSKLKEVKKNHTFKFLFPLMYDKERNDESFIKKEFDSIYLGTGEYENKLILVYKPSNTSTFSELDSKLVSIKTFNTDIDLKDGKIAYVYNIPDKFISDLSSFKEGKYSEFSDKLKQQTLNFWGITKGDDSLYGILEKTDIAKKNFDKFAKKYKDNTAEEEYYPKPNMDEEYLEI